MIFPLNIFVVLVDVIIWENNKTEWILDHFKFLQNYRVQIFNTHPNDFLLVLTNHKNHGGSRDNYQSLSCADSYAFGWAYLDNNDTITLTRMFELIAISISYDMRCSPYESNNDLKICKENIRHAISINNNPRIACFKNKPIHIFVSPTCRNEFIENDEECDCGLHGNCSVKCISTTCKFVCPQNCNGNGVCDDDGKCNCYFGFITPTCEKNVDQTKYNRKRICDNEEKRNQSILHELNLILVIIIMLLAMVIIVCISC